MKLKLAVKTLLATFALSAALPLAAVAESTSASMKQYSSGSDTTQFRCVTTSDGHPATVATRGSRQSNPLFIWQTNYFGGNYPPERRCQIVSDRFNEAVRFNDGSLQGLLITNGYVKRQAVLCVVRFYGDECTDQNMLITLKPENANIAASIVRQIESFAEGDSDVEPVYESGGSDQYYADLSDMLEPSLGSSGSNSSGSNGGW